MSSLVKVRNIFNYSSALIYLHLTWLLLATPQFGPPSQVSQQSPGPLGPNGGQNSIGGPNGDKKDENHTAHFFLWNASALTLEDQLVLMSENGSVPSKLWKHGGAIKVIIHGYHADYTLTPLQHLEDHKIPVIAEEYAKANSSLNIIIVEWSALAIQMAYPVSAENTKPVGKATAEFLLSLHKRKAISDLSQVHLIGFSLGSHVSGVAGHQVQKLSKNKHKLGRITGLDPAGPLFDLDGGFMPDDTTGFLEKSDANFVDIIHCNMGTQHWSRAIPEGRLGSFVQAGHADFYPNGGMTQPHQCTPDLDKSAGCSHRCCVFYFAFSLTRPELACPCKTWEEYSNKLCSCGASKGVYMGDPCSTRAKGKYFVEMTENLNFTKLAAPQEVPTFNPNQAQSVAARADKLSVSASPGMAGASTSQGVQADAAPQFGGGQKGVPQMEGNQTGTPQFGASAMGGNQTGAPQFGGTQIGGNQTAAPQFGFHREGGNQTAGPQFGAHQMGANQTGAPQFGSPAMGGNQTGGPQFTPSTMGGNQTGAPQFGAHAMGGNQTGAPQFGATQVGGNQTGAPKFGSNAMGGNQTGAPQFGSHQMGGNETGAHPFGGPQMAGNQTGHPQFGAHQMDGNKTVAPQFDLYHMGSNYTDAPDWTHPMNSSGMDFPATGTTRMASNKMDSNQLDVPQTGVSTMGASHPGADQVGGTQLNSAQAGASQIDTFHMNPNRTSTSQFGVNQTSAPQMGLNKMGANQTGVPQMNTNQTGAPHLDTSQMGTSSTNGAAQMGAFGSKGNDTDASNPSNIQPMLSSNPLEGKSSKGKPKNDKTRKGNENQMSIASLPFDDERKKIENVFKNLLNIG